MNDLAEIELEIGDESNPPEKYYEGKRFTWSRAVWTRSELLASQLVRGRIDVQKHDYAQAEKSFREV